MPIQIRVSKVKDFELTAKEVSKSWDELEWQTLNLLDSKEESYKTKIKIAYSTNGIYLYFDCEDKKISCTNLKDFDEIIKEYVIEAFFWCDQTTPLYFEYELSPLGAELPILVSNNEGSFMGWRPWLYEGDRLVKKTVRVRDGEQKAGAEISGWCAEIFFPFALFKGLRNSKPESGTEWRANFYRMDYDSGKCLQWAWAPVSSGDARFHRYQEFGSLIFL